MTISHGEHYTGTNNKPLLLDISNTTLHLTPEQFERLCLDNPDLKLELTGEGKLIVNPSVVLDEDREAITAEDLPQLTKEETAQRVTVLERYQQRRQKIIDNLTPEELEESNRQFEEMFKILAESRS